jgi:hypothetical protein
VAPPRYFNERTRREDGVSCGALFRLLYSALPSSCRVTARVFGRKTGARSAVRALASPSIDGNWYVGCDVGVHGICDHRAHQHDADEDAAEDSSGYKKLGSSHDALRLMTHRHLAKLTMPSPCSAHSVPSLWIRCAHHWAEATAMQHGSAATARKSAWKSIEKIIRGSVWERSSFNTRYTAPHQQLRSHSYESTNCGMRICDPLGRP